MAAALAARTKPAPSTVKIAAGLLSARTQIFFCFAAPRLFGAHFGQMTGRLFVILHEGCDKQPGGKIREGREDEAERQIGRCARDVELRAQVRAPDGKQRRFPRL